MVNTMTQTRCWRAVLAALVASLAGCDGGDSSADPVASGGTGAEPSGGSTSVAGTAGANTAGSGGSGGSAGSPSSAGAGGANGAVGCGRPAGMGAVTLTYDDALLTQLDTAAPLLKEHALPATFFVTDVRSSQALWGALLADGHELAAHTFLHPCPKVNTWVAPGNANEDYDMTRMATELDESVAMLESLGQSPPFTFAYPCGVDWIGEAQESYVPLIQERFSAARGVVPGAVQAGVNLWNVPATFSTGTGAELIALAEQAKNGGTWVVFGFHGIGGDTNAIAADAHAELVTYLDEQRDALYVATFRELAACFAP